VLTSGHEDDFAEPELRCRERGNRAACERVRSSAARRDPHRPSPGFTSIKDRHGICAFGVVLGQHEIVDAYELQPIPQVPLGGLYRKGIGGSATQVIQVQPAGEVGSCDNSRVLGSDSSVVQAVRQAQQVARETITAEMRTLPSLLSEHDRKGSGERTTPLGATRIVAAMRADQELGILARLKVRRLREIDIEDLTQIAQFAVNERRLRQAGVRYEELPRGAARSLVVATNEQHPNASSPAPHAQFAFDL